MPTSFLGCGVRGRAGCVPVAVRRKCCQMRHRLIFRQPNCLMVRMPASPCLICVNSYYFSSNRRRVKLARCHPCCHRVTRPAAQEQQEDHGDEQGAAHL